MKLFNRISQKSVQNSPPSLPISQEQRQQPEARDQRRRDRQLLAHDAMMMGDADDLLQTQRDADRRDRCLPPESAAMSRSIQIGDNTHYHYQQTAAKTGIGPLGKLALAAGIAAGTGGLGISLWNLIDKAGPIAGPIREVIDNTRDVDIDVKSRYVPPTAEGTE